VQQQEVDTMSNARFSIIQAKAVKDKRVSDAQFRTLAALGMYADEEGWCFPSLTTLGNDLGKSKQATGRDTIALKKLGYLETTSRYDKKTGARHSNLYRLKFDFPPILPRQPDVDAPSTPEVDINVHEQDEALSKIATAYQSEIGLITSMIADDLQDAAKSYPVKWVLDAIHEAAVQNKRGWKYCLAILKRWNAQGNQEPANKKAAPLPPPAMPDMGDLEARYGF
jgi:DnaD/phage-associated family protein